MENILKKLNKIEKEILKDCWNYNKNILKDCGLKKISLKDELYNEEFSDWEDVGFFTGYLRALDDFKEIIKNNKLKK